MLRRTVAAPDGTEWTLGRRWFPRRRRLGRVDIGDIGGVPDFGGGLDDLGVIGVIIGAILLTIATVILVLVLVNVLAIALELMILIVALLAGVVGRVVFRRPWTVFARSPHVTHERQVVGWRASRRLLRELAARLSSGLELEAPAGDRR